MSNRTARNRKTACVVGLLVLLVPIVLLGMPASADSSGGLLARMRSDHDFGESDLGQIDPTSATMNLVLLGMRGIAVNFLRMDLDYYKDHKEWARLQSTTEAVITLQPHYIEVWRFLSWNLAYNVSAEWDAVPDRYYWVKQGGKFSQRGTVRNREIPELYWETGRVWGQKVGRSDEWKYFRKYFLKDPDQTHYEGVDPEINPQGIDNYLVAKGWYSDANSKEDKRDQHIMMRALFRSYPARSALDYADALQREGQFTGTTVAAWREANIEWTQRFGKMPFQSPDCIVELESNEDDVKRLAANGNVSVEVVRKWLNSYQNVTNYRYWRTRSQAEANQETAESRQLLFDGESDYHKGELATARQKIFRGMTLYAQLLERYPELSSEDQAVEDGLWAVLLWQKVLELEGQPVPPAYPLKNLWDSYQSVVPTLLDRFNRSTGND